PVPVFGFDHGRDRQAQSRQTPANHRRRRRAAGRSRAVASLLCLLQQVLDQPVHGPAHHCAVGIGHIAGKIETLGKLLQMETVKVC
ncbi:MAG: hypothetical protein FJ388_10525, partial [Verrucomicrobia bacterium]|nr:hypothetical protein [Verrucomicrobiota bacterium]